ncbi:MAG: hypothetical protein CVV64_08425 [Candidatus Wallbacteria bacterium HGW-Wallbacteria-1]|jgi:DNA-binding NtrC family response regulator|uniref:Fis family transcriptional regulator n=1 Tax=Candidatus Wallbacteria bacterium HGW-Wallbacteria-1 TaxID=2013854 RepID=A0A2N1PPX0_9BACT|nr:MAG: hypothetical protein CVV64_08425 [Candidatus Wallbacteria bacterium HGW-Wallbacteria-1]
MGSRGNILIVDDEQNLSYTLKLIFERAGYRVLTAENGVRALVLCDAENIAVVLADVSMAGMDGLELLDRIRMSHPEIEVVMMTAYGSEEIAVRAMKAGAYDYIPKPFKNEEMLLVVEKAMEKYILRRRADALQKNLEDRFSFGRIIGSSKPMMEIFELLAKISETDVTTLILGESGTGKELIASAIHFNGLRREKPFVKLNCAAIPETLLESELFGHERGAFTGAFKSRIGKFEAADNGTLFLDEIGDMSLSTQAKVLRVIQEQEFERVGGKETIKTNVRLIAATHRNLEKGIRDGTFRADLFYRLNVITVKVPPLRDRREDIPMLVGHFLREIAENDLREGHSGLPLAVEPAALRSIMEYSWPGNIRELRNALERAAVLASGNRIVARDLPENLRGRTPSLFMETRSRSWNYQEAKTKALEEFDRHFIMDALQRNNGNVSRAAGEAGMYRANFYQKMQKHSLRAEDYKIDGAGQD